MYKFFLTAIFSLLIFGSLSCDSKKDRENKPAVSSNEVILYNWKEYTSLETLKKFEKESGIKVILKEFETIDEQIGKLQSNPFFCDLTVIDSHVAAGQYLSMKLITRLDLSKLKHIPLYENHFKDFKEVGIPYSYGITGFAIDTRQVKKTYENYSFLTDPAYKGKISFLDDQFDLFLDLLVALNIDINSDIDPQTRLKLNVFVEQIKNNECDFDETFTNLDKLVEGKKWIVQTYSGDAASYMKDHEYIAFIFNKNSYNAWSETVCLTQNSPNKENAYKLLNFLSRPENAAAFSNEFYYANGIIGSSKFMDEELKKNPLINIPEEIRKKGVFYLKSKDSNSLMQEIFSKISSLKKNDDNEKED